MKLSDVMGAQPAAPSPQRLSQVMASSPTPQGPGPGRVERFGMGVTTPIEGIAQGAAHMGAVLPPAGMPEFGQYTPDLLQPRPTAAGIDKAVQGHEQQYQARRAAAGQTGTDWYRGAGELAGNVALAAPLAPLGVGEGGFIASVARGLGVGALAGAEGGAAQPVTGGGSYSKQKAGQVLSGTVSGAAVGGVLGPLGRAIAGQDAGRAAEIVKGSYYKAIRPGKAMTAPQRGVYENEIRDGIDSIIDNAGGKPLPRTPQEFSTAIGDTKTALHEKYTALAAEAEKKGARVDLDPVAAKLREIAGDKLRDPAAHAEAQRLLKLIPGRGARVSPATAEDWLTRLNRRASGYETGDPTGTGGAIREIAGALRSSLVDAVDRAGFPEYARLRRSYSSLIGIEKDVGGAAGVALRGRSPYGLSEIAATGAAAAGEPTTAAGIEGVKFLTRWLNSPNRAISRMFDAAADARHPVPAELRDLRTRIGSMVKGSTAPAAGAAGGEAGGP